MIADVDEPPGTDPIAVGIRTAQHPGFERCLLAVAQPFRPARARPVVQIVRPFGIVADHRVAQRLPLHPGQPRRFRPRHALQRVRDCQQAHRRSPIRLKARQAAELTRRQVLADGKSGHDTRPPQPCQQPIPVGLLAKFELS